MRNCARILPPQFLHQSLYVQSNARKFLGIIGEDPSDSKSNRIHVDIFQFLLDSFEVYSIDSSKMIGNFPKVLNFNWLFLKLGQLICN